MPYKYEAEIHDWDMTLRASGELLSVAQKLKDHQGLSFSLLTGSMLLAFCAVESFLNSVAFQMSKSSSFAGFPYAKYAKRNGIWHKIRTVCTQIDVEFDNTKEPFNTFERMRLWRNALVHTEPYSVAATTIENPSIAPQLHASLAKQEYTKSVSVENANAFYDCAFDVIELVKNASGLEPRAMCYYEVV